MVLEVVEDFRRQYKCLTMNFSGIIKSSMLGILDDLS